MRFAAARGKAPGSRKEICGCWGAVGPKNGQKPPGEFFLDFATDVAKNKKCSERGRSFGCGPEDVVEKRLRTYW